MSCRARNLENSIGFPSIKNLNINDTNNNDIKLNLKLLNKHLEVKSLDETLVHRQNEYKIRREHLQKRQDALHEKEVMFKERILSYEMYIKELAMKRDRSLRRIDDEKTFIKTKQIEIDLLNKEIEQIHEEKQKLQQIIVRYQPHATLLNQIIDRTDRFHSIDEMIDKFDMLYASYQDILITIRNSNEELNDVQRQLLLTIEKKNNKISLMNNQIHDLHQNHIDIQQRIEKIQTEIANYQQISKERLSEHGAIIIAIESMFDLVKRYSHRSGRKDLNLVEHPLIQLKQIDTFLGDLIYYVDYVNNKEKKLIQKQYSNDGENRKIQVGNNFDYTKGESEDNNRWRTSCEIDRREIVIDSNDKHGQSPYFSYKIRSEDNTTYTIQVNTAHQPNPIQARNSLSPNRSSISMSSRSNETKSNSFKVSSIDKAIKSTRTTMKTKNH